MPIAHTMTTQTTATYADASTATFIRPPIFVPPTTLGYYIEGGEGNDILSGSKGADEIHGRGGNDLLGGFEGDDRLFGEDGDDQLNGDIGNDLLDGGIGNDVLVGGAGADTFVGGAGFDIVTYEGATLGVTVDMATIGVTNEAQGDTYSGIEQIIGSNFGDILNGNAAGNVLNGGPGDDWLFGQAGDDTLIGWLGVDRMVGGAGADGFLISPGSGLDIISDFQPGSDHLIVPVLGGSPFGSDGQLASGFWSVDITEPFGTVGLDAGDLLAFNRGDHTLYQIEVGWDDDLLEFYVSAATPVAVFANGVDIHTSDFPSLTSASAQASALAQANAFLLA
jgi:Ca2+-binding RTX toxin-like protein